MKKDPTKPTITHPTDAQGNQPQPGCRHFAAFGTAPTDGDSCSTCGKITALLKVGKRIAAVGKTVSYASQEMTSGPWPPARLLHRLEGEGVGSYFLDCVSEAPNWVVHFHVNLKTSTTYKVEVYGDLQDDPIATSTFKTGGVRGIQPSYPPDGATVAPSFTAYGTDDPGSYSIYGQLTKGGKATIGITLQGPPDYVFQFNGVPSGTYTLTIQDTDAPPSQTIPPATMYEP
jgi:hypothetical protein